jgi:hypothetical protein
VRKELTPVQEIVACDVCGRTILKGERTEPYLVPDGSRRLVCELCTRRAEGAGWVRESSNRDAFAAFPRAEPRRSLVGRLRRRFVEHDHAAGGAENGPARAEAPEEEWQEYEYDALEREEGLAEPADAELDAEELEPDELYEDPDGLAEASATAADEDAPPPSELEEEPPPVPADADAPVLTPRGRSGAAPFEDEPVVGDASGVRDESTIDDELSASDQSVVDEGAVVDAAPRRDEAGSGQAAAPLDAPRDADGSPEARAEDLEALERRAEEAAASRRDRRRRRLRDPRHVRAVPTNSVAKVERALEIFNGTEYRRTVAGLVRTLGDPWVTAMPRIESTSEVVVVVAWELSWYQYRIDLADADEPVALMRKGREVTELDDKYRRWNAGTTPDGALKPGRG